MKLRHRPAPPQASLTSVMGVFQRIMSALFTQIRIVVPEGTTESAYHICVDETLELHFFPDQDGYLNVVANSNPLPNPLSSECLLQLLNLNTFLPVHPNVSVGVIHDQRTAQIWTTQYMQQMNDKDALRLLRLITNTVNYVNTILAEPLK